MGKVVTYHPQGIEPAILNIRGQKVVLDMELARIYGVTTKAFNQAVKRNRRRFPPDFMFRLTSEEYDGLRLQMATLNRSQIVTGSQKHRDPKYVPYAFTEHGAVMAATVLHSERAIIPSSETRCFNKLESRT